MWVGSIPGRLDPSFLHRAMPWRCGEITAAAHARKTISQSPCSERLRMEHALASGAGCSVPEIGGMLCSGMLQWRRELSAARHTRCIDFLQNKFNKIFFKLRLTAFSHYILGYLAVSAKMEFMACVLVLLILGQIQ